MENCIFCKIISEKIPRVTEMETENLVVFKDAHPKAPIHLLIVPREHILDLSEASDKLWIEIKETVLKLADKLNPLGYRIINNSKAAQEVKHLHIHFLGEVGVDREI